MKTSIYLSLIFTVLLFSCGQQQKENNNFADFDADSEVYHNSEENSNYNRQPTTKTPPRKENLKGYKVMSKQFGMPVGVMPIPSSWEVKNNSKEGILFESADGVKVYGERFISHFYSNNQELNYFAQQSGSKIKPVKNLQRVIKEDILPYAESQGIRLVNQFPLPQLAQFDKRFDGYLFKGMPENKQFQCIATEWIDKDGGKSIGVIRYYICQYPTTGGIDWGYTLNSMGASKDNYETAKKAFINSLVNFQINPQWVEANNRYYSQQSRQSNAGHQQRMAALKAQGQASRNISNTYSSISDSNHESWKRRNGMQDAGHANSINSGVWERSTITNPNTGQSYQVEGQYNQYHMNNNNEYIGTDNTLYNPNLDPNMNNQDWTQYNTGN